MTKICLESHEKMSIRKTEVVYHTFPECNSIWGVNDSKLLVTNTQIICNWKYIRRTAADIHAHE